jgi:NADP-dependent 3-hydroxy acid dehydrogenase YdfG
MADFESMIEVNLTGLLRMLHLSLPGLLGRAKRGEVSHVIQIGSVAGRWAYPKGHVYCATKAAVSSLTQSLRLDLSGTGVRVTEIVPGKVETEFSLVRFQGDQKQAQAAYEGYRPLRSEDIARSIKFCLEQPLHVNIQEMVIYPTDQASPTVLSKSPDLLGNRKKKSRK